MNAKLRSVLNHPVTGLVTIVAIQTATVVAIALAARKLEKIEEETVEA